MRILMYMTSSRPFIAGGAQAVFRDLVASFRERGHRVDEAYLQVPAYRRKQNGNDVWGLSIRGLDTANGLPTRTSLRTSAKSFARVLYMLAFSRPDVVYVHFVKKEAAYFTFFQPLFRYRLVLGAQGSDVLVSNGEALDRQVQGVVARADAVVAVSGSVEEKVRSLTAGRPVEVAKIYNGVDADYWAPPSDTSDDRAPVVVSVGRLTEVKGHDVLVRAFRQVLARVPSARLVLIGDGRERDALAALAAAEDVDDAVEFAGTLDRDAIRQRLHEAAVFAMPSRSEGFGLAALEAMAAGLPVVGSAVGGLPELVADEGGVLVPPDDAGALAGALVGVLADHDRRDRLARGARERAKRFSWERAVDAYERTFAGCDPSRI